MANETFRSDGKAVDVVVAAVVTKGDVILAQGWHGIALADAISGQTIAIEICREHEILVPAALVVAKGDVLYLSAAGVITKTTTDRPFAKTTKAKNASNYVWAILLPQTV